MFTKICSELVWWDTLKDIKTGKRKKRVTHSNKQPGSEEALRPSTQFEAKETSCGQ